MKGYYFKLILIIIVSMTILLFLLDNIFIAALINFPVMYVVMYGYNMYLLFKISLILDEKCDPVKFLEENEKIKKVSSKSLRSKLIFGINEAAGLITLGKFSQAKEILLNIYKCYIPKNRYILLVYNINLMSCFYELGEITNAEEIFKSEFLTLSTKNERINISIELIKAERLFYLNQLEESKKQFQHIQKMKLSKRQRIAILYNLAQIDEKMGDYEQAKSKYLEVTETGNQLWIAKQSKMKLELLCNQV